MNSHADDKPVTVPVRLPATVSYYKDTWQYCSPDVNAKEAQLKKPLRAVPYTPHALATAPLLTEAVACQHQCPAPAVRQLCAAQPPPLLSTPSTALGASRPCRCAW